MRKTAYENGVSLRAYAGTTGVLLAMNVEPHKRDGLLGFAIERRRGHFKHPQWLTGGLTFPGMPHEAGAPVPTNKGPIQWFRWSDYRVYPDTEYEYVVHPVYGEPGRLEVQDGPALTVTTQSVHGSEHAVLFNRAAAASQAFSKKFPEVEAELEAARRARREPDPLPPAALAWLSRGVLEQIVGFIEQAADETWALDIAIYEYELEEIVSAVNAAHARGANVRVVYHARRGDEQTKHNEQALVGLPAEAKRARVTSKICHHKFIVLSRVSAGVREPQAVLCGSTNFTHNGVYRQANVVHVVSRQDVARQYLQLFDVLFAGENVSGTRRHIGTHNPFAPPQPLFAGFSPRSGGADLEAFAALVQEATRDVLFCTAFDLYDGLEDALLGEAGDPILRYGLQNRRSRITGVHRDRTADFAATAMLASGLEGFLKESTKGQRGNILIHTKLIIVDFTSDSPTVISGSHNFSRSASEGNDENFLIVRGNTDVADAYGCELMRLYDHYRFRSHRNNSGRGQRRIALRSDDSWTDRYFEWGSLEESDRLRFASHGGSPSSVEGDTAAAL